MAEGKKIVSVYVDWVDVFEKLEDDEAGRLIKHFFRYVNDQNPQVPDRLTDIAFEPIKKQLQRDLDKWEAVCERNRKNGMNGGRPKTEVNRENPVGLSGFTEKPKKPDTDTDTDTDIYDTDKDIIEKKKFSFKKSLIALGVEEILITDWLTVRKQKKAANTETAFIAVKREIELSSISPNECIRIAVEKSWQGFKAEWIKPFPTGYQHPSNTPISNVLTNEQLNKF